MILWLLACRGDPQMDRLRSALSAYERGQAALDAGDFSTAAAAFEEAALSHPESPSLRGWHAMALAEGGDVPAARGVLDAAIPSFPGNADLRYNRAAFAARQDDLEAAATDLRYLYARDLLDPLVAGEDPDFASLGRDPRYAALAPPPQVRVEVRGEAGSILLGEPFTMELVIESKTDEAISVENIGAAPALLSHSRTIEDLTIQDEGWSRRVVRVEWTARSAGEESIGPWLVSAHGTSAISDRLPVVVVALPGQEGAEPAASLPGLLLPSQIFPRAEVPQAVRLADGRVAVLHGVSDTVTSDRAVGQLEHRVGGQTHAMVSLLPEQTALPITLSDGSQVSL